MKRGAMAVPYEALEAMVQAHGFPDATVLGLDVHPVTRTLVVLFASEHAEDVPAQGEAVPVFLQKWDVERRGDGSGWASATTRDDGTTTAYEFRPEHVSTRFVTGWQRTS